MAALGTIRKRGAFLVFIIGLGLFAFIAEEMFRSCEATSNEKRQQVGEVLGEKVSVQEFQNLVDELQGVIKITEGRDNLTEDELNWIKDQVWDTFVSTAILSHEAQKVGLTVTDTELQNILKEGTNRLLLGVKIFVNPQTGRFDVSILTKFLAEYKNAGTQSPQIVEQYRSIYNYWKFIEKTLRQQTLQAKYITLLSKGLISNPVSAKMAFDSRYKNKTIKLASIAYSTIGDDKVQVSDADIKAKYEEKKEMFKHLTETRDIKYVDVQVLPSDADRENLLKTMNEVSGNLRNGEDPVEIIKKVQSQISYTGLPLTSKAYPSDISSRLDSMTVGQTTEPFETKSDNTYNVIKLISKVQMPDSIEYRQIQIAGQTIEDARKRADSVYTALKNGADFEEMAKKYGQDGEKITITSAMYETSQSFDADTKSYLEALNTLGVNEVKNLAFTQGNVIVQVTDRKAMVNKYLAAVVKHTIDFSKSTYSSAYNKFSQFVSENQTLEAMEKNAAKYGYKILERNNITNAEHNVVGIRNTRDAMKWIFEAKAGEISPLYECGTNDHLLVLAMTKTHPVGYLDMDDVKDFLKTEIVRDKKFDMLKDKLAGVNSIDDAKSKGANIDEVKDITFNASAFIQSTNSSEPSISGAVAGTKKGQFCKRVIKGNAGAYMFQVIGESQHPGEKFESKTIESQLSQMTARTVANSLKTELYIKANVVDNRYLFF